MKKGKKVKFFKKEKVKEVDAMKLAKDVLLLTGGIVVISAAANIIN